MKTSQLTTLQRSVIFAFLYLTIFASSFTIIKSAIFQQNPSLAWAVLFDMTLLPAFIFYIVIARPIQLSTVRIFLILILILRIAFFIVPLPQNTSTFNWAFLPVFIELVTLLFLFLRLRLIVRKFNELRADADFETAMEGAINSVTTPKISAIIATEIKLVYYSLLGFWVISDIPRQTNALTTHRKSAQTALMISLLAVSAIEAAGVHILVSSRSPNAAFWITALSFYGMLFILADLTASRKRPSYISEKIFHLRLGIRWRAIFPLSDIGKIERITQKQPKSGDVLNGTFLVTPNTLISFTKPITATGLYGIKREVTTVTLFLDNPEELLATWENQ